MRFADTSVTLNTSFREQVYGVATSGYLERELREALQVLIICDPSPPSPPRIQSIPSFSIAFIFFASWTKTETC